MPAIVALQIVIPTAGSSYQIGQILPIQWNVITNPNTPSHPPDTVIELSRNGGASYEEIGSVYYTTTAFNWLVHGPTSSQCRIRLRNGEIDPDTGEFLGVEAHSGIFSIVGSGGGTPSLSLISPNGRETTEIGSQLLIRWSSANITGGLGIDISRNSGATWQQIISSVAIESGQVAWTVTGPATTLARIRIRSLLSPSLTDVSSSDFTIAEATQQTGPALKVSTPNGGELYGVGERMNIIWSNNTTLFNGNVKIEISYDNGNTWSTIAASVPSSARAFTWLIGSTTTSAGKIRISDAADGSPSDTSDGVFSITQEGIFAKQMSAELRAALSKMDERPLRIVQLFDILVDEQNPETWLHYSNEAISLVPKHLANYAQDTTPRTYAPYLMERSDVVVWAGRFISGGSVVVQNVNREFSAFYGENTLRGKTAVVSYCFPEINYETIELFTGRISTMNGDEQRFTFELSIFVDPNQKAVPARQIRELCTWRFNDALRVPGTNYLYVRAEDGWLVNVGRYLDDGTIDGFAPDGTPLEDLIQCPYARYGLTLESPPRRIREAVEDLISSHPTATIRYVTSGVPYSGGVAGAIQAIGSGGDVLESIPIYSSCAKTEAACKQRFGNERKYVDRNDPAYVATLADDDGLPGRVYHWSTWFGGQPLIRNLTRFASIATSVRIDPTGDDGLGFDRYRGF